MESNYEGFKSYVEDCAKENKKVSISPEFACWLIKTIDNHKEELEEMKQRSHDIIMKLYREI